MKVGFDKVDFFNPAALKNVAWRHVTIFYRRVVDKGLDYKGKKFKRYSKSYTDLLKKDFRTVDGKRIKGYEGLPSSTTGNKLSNRPLFLRGISMSNLKPRGANRDSYTIGWDGEAAAIIDGQANKGRNIRDDLPPEEWAWVEKQLGKIVDKEFKKIPNNINLGKR